MSISALPNYLAADSYVAISIVNSSNSNYSAVQSANATAQSDAGINEYSAASPLAPIREFLFFD